MRFYEKIKKSIKEKKSFSSSLCFEDIKMNGSSRSKTNKGSCFQAELALGLLTCSPCILGGAAVACGIIYGLSFFDDDIFDYSCWNGYNDECSC